MLESFLIGSTIVAGTVLIILALIGFGYLCYKLPWTFLLALIIMD